MWLLVAREPRPDAPDWPGRRLLAAVDAVAWPLMWMLLIQQVPGPAGLVGPFVTALAVLLGLGRLHRALCVNHRYWFTTWRWVKVLGAMLLIGAVLKIAMTA
jgi:membrane-associated PAP2 superfamily phosphatase